MNIAIVGAGIGGMAAAWDFVRAGHQVTIYESAPVVGGLAAGFKQPHWKWSLENFYHHWFQTDADMLGLIRELGLESGVRFPRPKTVSYYEGGFYPLDSPVAALKFPAFNILDVARFGFVTIYIRYLAGWKALEKVTADEWLKKVYGKRLYGAIFEPMLIGKFGPFYKEVNMAWFWARLKTRTTRLGTYEGGFQAFSDAFAAILRQRGVEIRLSTPIHELRTTTDNKVEVCLADGTVQTHDRSLVTVSPGQMARMTPTLPAGYLDGLLKLKNMGAVVVILALKQALSPQGYYWYNIPKAYGFPFLSLVEHTNFVPAENFGGDHLIYIGDYLEVDHENFRLSKEELVARFLPYLTKINPDFKPDWVRDSWMVRTTYAQPIPLVNHSANIPALQTPLPGIYFASMSQVYPWDRGTNFAVQVARKAARLMMAE